MDNPLTAVIAVLLGGAVLALTCAWMTMPETPTDIEIEQKTRHVAFEGSSFHVEVIVVDGVEYVVASTYHGVGICPKQQDATQIGGNNEMEFFIFFVIFAVFFAAINLIP